MRLRSSLSQLLAVGQGGAIMEEGDAELLLPPVLQPVVTIGGPLSSMGGAVGTVQQSAIANGASFVSGVAGAFTSDMITLGSGIWLLDLRLRWYFTGTTDVTKSASVTFIDPDANTQELLGGGFFSGIQANEHTQFTIAFDRAGWLVRLRRDPTIAGDIAELRATLLAFKLT